jgi:hypothetical protein
MIVIGVIRPWDRHSGRSFWLPPCGDPLKLMSAIQTSSTSSGTGSGGGIDPA